MRHAPELGGDRRGVERGTDVSAAGNKFNPGPGGVEGQKGSSVFQGQFVQGICEDLRQRMAGEFPKI